MQVSDIIIFLVLISLSKSASIKKFNEILKKDVAEVGSAIENFTFDVLKEIVEDPEETTTVKKERKKRSTEDAVRQFCQQRCEEAQRIETQQIRELKEEVGKLQDMVNLLREQQKIINVLEENSTTTEAAPKQTRQENEEREENENVPNSEELKKMKNELKEVINTLNQTRELMEFQKKKDQLLEEELVKQKNEIENLKSVVNVILHKNVTEKEINSNGTENSDEARETEIPSPVSARASEFSTLRKLLKSLPEEEEDNDDLQSKLVDLQKHLNKKRRQQSLLTELKQLEKSLDDDSGGGDNNLLRQIIEAIKKTEPKSRSDDLEINTLGDLSEAINRLRPKEDQTAQFQTMLSKLINKPANQGQSQITITPQQMNELTKKLTPNNYPYICIVDDGGVKSNGYRAPVYTRNFQSPPPIDYSRGQQFFPGQFAQPNYVPQGSVNGPGYEKPPVYTGENGDPNQKYQDDLRQQIDGLQAAIDNLNRPEYLQRPEDKAVVDNLEKQIGELRNIVSNLNYDGNSQAYQRTKRSLENNEVEDSQEIVQKMSKFVNELLDSDDKTKTELDEIQRKITTIKNHLNSNNTILRAAEQPYGPQPQPQAYLPIETPSKDLKRSFKTDFLSEIIGKIVEKLLNAVPVVIQRLFHFTLEQLSKYDYQDYDIQVLSKNLGIFAYLPIILLRLIRGFTAFMNMLRKSSFIKNFLMPAIILGTVAGSVLFLIWWLQPDATNTPYNYVSGDSYDQNYQTYQNSQYTPTTQTSQPSSQYPVSYNYPVYNRSYFNK